MDRAPTRGNPGKTATLTWWCRISIQGTRSLHRCPDAPRTGSGLGVSAGPLAGGLLKTARTGCTAARRDLAVARPCRRSIASLTMPRFASRCAARGRFAGDRGRFGRFAKRPNLPRSPANLPRAAHLEANRGIVRLAIDRRHGRATARSRLAAVQPVRAVFKSPPASGPALTPRPEPVRGASGHR